jgi:hypothetical protein
MKLDQEQLPNLDLLLLSIKVLIKRPKDWDV